LLRHRRWGRDLRDGRRGDEKAKWCTSHHQKSLQVGSASVGCADDPSIGDPPDRSPDGRLKNSKESATPWDPYLSRSQINALPATSGAFPAVRAKAPETAENTVNRLGIPASRQR
jgi:hypothetical protein